MDTMTTTYNTVMADAASEILGKERRRKKPWVTKDVLDLCDKRRDLKKKRYEAEGAKEYTIFIAKFSKGHNSIKNVGGITVLFLCTSSENGLYFYKVS